ncbi:MAG: B12-binding domain-containing radical SAM protein [Nitrososphaerota archaeon]|nr:B12-binding domain-containing radical SAM protein [Nitrososphaerota archaeon]
MARFVLVSDVTLSRSYRNVPLLDFLASAPSDTIPCSLYSFLRGPPPPAVGGRAAVAPYAVRKLEAALLNDHTEAEVVVAQEEHLADFVGDDTEVIGVSTMDPLGLGPLTMSYAVFFETAAPAYVQKDFEGLVSRINAARKGKKAKLLVGGPGVWELTVRPEELERNHIDYAFQGEADDIASDLFRYVTEGGGENTEFFRGYQTFNEAFRREWEPSSRFVSRYPFSKQFPSIEEIPEIVNPTVKGMVEVMRGCGVGCDFCEVTLRPLRYYPPEKVRKEISVNARAGMGNAWLHSDEIFAYQHGRNYVPNEDALMDLLTTVMTTRGMGHTNPTHGRISIPAAYPDLMRKVSGAIRSGPDNWIGVQVGIETGSDRLAAKHMPNKTLPLKVGPDGSWSDIVWRGTYIMNKYYWRPAFTVQVGQAGETSEDNWETVALINRMSSSTLENGVPFEFTVTPMQNVPLGLLKSRDFGSVKLDPSQLAVYYAAYRHLAKMAARNASHASSETGLASRYVAGALIGVGGRVMFGLVRSVCKKGGLDIEKAAAYGLSGGPHQPLVVAK